MTCAELEKAECSSGACLEKTLLCDFSNDCFESSSDEEPSLCSTYKFRCAFENGLCSDWTQENDDTADWILVKASSANVGLLPEYDHTTMTTEGNTTPFPST